jgi:hypothetical protein
MASMQFNITDAVQRSVQSGMQRGMEQAANQLVHEVTEKLAKKFDFDVEQAIALLGVVTIETKKKTKETKTKRPSTKKPKVMELQLPWCGEVISTCCQAIKHSNRLYVQCMNAKQDDGDYCKRCQTAANKNDGKPIYGVIQDRLKDDFIGKDGEMPVNYGNYMRTKGIKREDAEAEAIKLGWTIPEEQFVVVEVKKGRKPKAKKANIETSDTEEVSDTEDEKDIVKQAMEKASSDTSDDDSSDDEVPLVEVSKKRKSDHKQVTLNEPEESESSSGEQDPKRTRFEVEENTELEEEKMNESDEEGDLNVEPFEHKGKDYLIDAEDTVYDVKTESPVGEYDRENDVLTIF